MRSSIAILVPVYFNERNLPTTIPALLAVLDGIPEMDGQIVFVDDGSGDGSYGLLKEAAARDSRIRVIRLARNVGAYYALLAGIDHIDTDCTAIIMADLQDPPELIKDMVREWRAGKRIVLAERIDREDDVLSRMFASFFWWFVRRFGPSNVPRGGFDFVLFDRCVARVLSGMREKNSHFMLQVLWTGFPHSTLTYTRRKRVQGRSRWTFAKKLKLFIDTAVVFTQAPIKAMWIAGIITSLTGMVLAVALSYFALTNSHIEGWSVVLSGLLIVGGAIMAMNGLLGEYIWRTYDEARHRPQYIVAETINVQSNVVTR